MANMDNLLSGALGGLIGTILSSIVAYLLFRRQVRIDSNRHFLQEMMEMIRRIYLNILRGNVVEDKEIDYLISFQAIGLKEFRKLNQNLLDIRKTIHSYNDGVQKTLTSTNTSSLQITSKSVAEEKIKELVQIIRELS